MHVVATAGHVDHGKSALIRALTGMEPDRWAEEKRRGMTIDLGYAWTVLPSGAEIAFVDVPGHQRFITSMLAGVGPVPAVLLVIAADAGWSRQTGEHLAALEALGVRHGVLALTRSDLGDADLALEEARDYLAESCLAGIEAVAVSSVTGVGLDDVRAALDRMVTGLPAPAVPVSRLWIDRVFTIRGAGTVVTGTLGSGTVRVGDELQISSSGEPVTVRSIETLKRSVESVSAVARVALNLRRVKRADIRRGDALVRAGEWLPVTSMDVRLVNAPEKPPQHPMLHVGSAARQVRLRILDGDTARLSWDAPLPLRIGERAVLRNPGNQHVIAGVVALDVLPPALGGRGAARRRSAELADMTGEPDVTAELARRGFARRVALAAAGALGSAAPAADVVSVGDWLVDAGQWTAWQRQVREEVTSWRSADPLVVGMPAPVLAQVLGLPDPMLLTALLATVPELVSDSDGVHPAEATATLPDAAQAGLDKLRERLLADPFAAAEAEDLRALGLDGRHLAIAVRSGHLIAAGPGIYLRPEAVDDAVRLLQKVPQPFTLREACEALGTTRRVALPLMELLDRQRLTKRVDANQRALR